MNALTIIQLSDPHACQKYLQEVDNVMGFTVSTAEELPQVDAVVLSGDTWEFQFGPVRVNSPAARMMMEYVRRLSNIAPVLIIQGTFTHDAPKSLDVFNTVQGIYPIIVVDRISQVSLSHDGKWEQSKSWIFDSMTSSSAALFSCMPTINKAHMAGDDANDAAARVGESIADVFLGWGRMNKQCQTAGIPTIGVGHGTVSGSRTEHGCPMIGTDHEFTVGSLFSAQCSAFMLGHIHKHQAWKDHDRTVAYAGSLPRLHFGELDDKGFLVWLVEPTSSSFEFIKTPAKVLLQIEFDGPPDIDAMRETAKQCEGAYVRVRYSVDEEYRSTVDKQAIRELFALAVEVNIEGRINPIQRTRAEGFNATSTLDEKIIQWGTVTNTDSKPLLERLPLLQDGKDAFDIAKDIINENR